MNENVDLTKGITKMKITAQDYQRYFNRYWFGTTKFDRKQTIEKIRQEYSGARRFVDGEYRGYKYFIVCGKGEGIMSYVFLPNGKELASSAAFFEEFDSITRRTKAYIRYAIHVFKYLERKENN